MQHPMRFVTALFVMALMSDASMARSADYTRPTRTGPTLRQEGMGQRMWSSLAQDAHAVVADTTAAPGVLERDWGGLGQDTAFFLGYQAVAAGILYLLPESVTKWSPEQRRTSMRRWWDNVRHPQWDDDNWYLNYLGHPYFGAIAYIRARERGFEAFDSFWYAALISGFYEFGIEALFERPSYQDLIITPVGGLLIGALLFEPLRQHIRGKPELPWYDHLTLAATDPLGTANRFFVGILGIETDIRAQFHLPVFAPPVSFDEPSARFLNRPQEALSRSPVMGIQFILEWGGPSKERRQSSGTVY